MSDLIADVYKRQVSDSFISYIASDLDCKFVSWLMENGYFSLNMPDASKEERRTAVQRESDKFKELFFKMLDDNNLEIRRKK